MKKILFLFVVMLSTLGAYAQSNTTPIKGDVNEDGVVDVADIVAIIDIMMNGGGTSGETTYYMYIGQTDPSTISSIDNNTIQLTGAGNWYVLSEGATGVWFNFGEDIPSTITQSVKGGDADKYWYVMVPVTPGTTLKPVASDMSTLDTSVSALSTKVYNGVTYQIYWYGGGTSARNTFFFAKKETDPNATMYYWYVGQEDPENINSIGTIATDYEHGGGWYELGTSVPETINQLVKGFDSSKTIYVIVPLTSGKTLKPTASDMSTIDTSVSALSTKVINDITYQIYSYGSGSSRKTIMFAKK